MLVAARRSRGHTVVRMPCRDDAPERLPGACLAGGRAELERARGHPALPRVAAARRAPRPGDRVRRQRLARRLARRPSASAFPTSTLIEAGANLGYAGGNNLGIRHALEHGARWVVLVNNDATVAPDVIDGFARGAARAAARGHPRRQGLLRRPAADDLVRRAARQRAARLLGTAARLRATRRLRATARCVTTGRAVGALMAISREAIEAVGLLDEDLFAYVEDVDWALRVRGRAWRSCSRRGARAWHRVSASTGGEAASTHTLYYGVRNTVTVLERRRPLGPARHSAAARRRSSRTFSLHALTRADRRAALRAVRAGFADARAGRLGARARASRSRRSARAGAPASAPWPRATPSSPPKAARCPVRPRRSARRCAHSRIASVPARLPEHDRGAHRARAALAARDSARSRSPSPSGPPRRRRPTPRRGW